MIWSDGLANWTSRAVLGLTAILVLVTLLSMIESSFWWIRMWDFPRLLILALAFVAIISAVWLLRGRAQLWAGIALILVVGWQSYRIFPYTVFAPSEVAVVMDKQARKEGHCFTAMNLNVYQHNRDYSRSIELIQKIDPDILLLLETDEQWTQELGDVLAAYPHRTLQPQDNTYGLLFLSRLPIESSEIRFLTEDDTPSIFAKVRTDSGARFTFIGLHPKPPQPGIDTIERDAEIVMAAKTASEAKLPVLAMGDFNDVAWSKTSQMFKRLGKYLDPRVGRGLFATFPAYWPAFRWPLDHVFFSRDFTVNALAVLGDVGSDHLPVSAELCLVPDSGRMLNERPERAKREDRQDAREMIEDFEEKKAEEQAGS